MIFSNCQRYTTLGCNIEDIVTIEKATSDLLKQFLEERKIKLPNSLYHEVQILFSYNSNRIEGSKLSMDETRYIYETNTVDGIKNVDDILETTNHFRCFDYMLDSIIEPLSENIFKKLHEILKNGTTDSRLPWFAVGAYKKKANTVGGLETCNPEMVESEVVSLLQWYNNKKLISLEDIAELHFRFEKIHPFQDGNGRVGRLIIFRECLRNNITPFIIEETHKIFYYRGLSEYKLENGYLIGTFQSAQDEFEKIVKRYK